MCHYLQISGILFRRYRIMLMLCCGSYCFVHEANGQNPFAGGNGTSGDPYLIATPAQLAKLAELVNARDVTYNDKCYKLVNDLDLSDYGANYNDGKGWIPIGKPGGLDPPFSFKGEFDGNNKKITGLHVNITNLSGFGLFGYIESAKILNLGVEGADIKGWSEIGGIVAIGTQNSSIANCYFASGTVRDGDNAGGIAGWFEGTITNCYSTGTVSGYSFVGGVVGNFRGSSIINCLSTGSVSGSTWVGGVAGWVIGEMTNCYSTNTVSAYFGEIGGVVGSIFNGSMTNCYSTGAVSANRDNAGGVVGVVRDGDITNCYSTGVISSGGIAGGIVSSADEGGSVTNCFSISEVSGDIRVGGIVGNVAIGCTITNCAAINPSVKGNSTVGRVIAYDYLYNVFSGNIAFCGMTTNGGAAFQGENTSNGLGGEDRSHFDLLTADGFPPGFTSSPWTYVPGKLPGLFGKTVDMPDHLRTYAESMVVALNANGSVTVYPIAFVENDPTICDLTFMFVVDGKDYASLKYTCADIGSNTISIVAIDTEGNRSHPKEITFTITAPPVVVIDFDVIPNRDVVLGEVGSFTIHPIEFVTNILYECDLTFYFVVNGVDRENLTFSCGDVGSRTVSIVAIDEIGNRSQLREVALTVSDRTPPIFDVISNRDVDIDVGSITVYPVDFVTNVSDNCSAEDNITFLFVVNGSDHESLTFTCDNIGSRTVSIVAIDKTGNRSQPQNVTFTVSDRTSPVFDVIPNRDITMNDVGSIIIYPVDFVTNVSDNCSGKNDITFMFVVDGVDRASMTLTCADIGSNTVLIVGIDRTGNRSQLQEVTFTISDRTPPVFDVISGRDIVLDNIASMIVYPADFVKNISDNCSGENDITFRFVVDGSENESITFTCNDVGSHTVSIVAADAKNNHSQLKNVTFTIRCRIPPDFDVISGKEVALNNTGIITVYPNEFVTNVSGYGDIIFRFVNGIDHESLTFTCNDIDSHTVSIVAIDAEGIRSQPQEVTFTVSDQTQPVARCKPATLYFSGDEKATLTTMMVDNGSTDNCGIELRQIKRTSDDDDLYSHSLDFDSNDLDVADGGYISVTLMIRDVSGNEASCTSSIRLVEQVPLIDLGEIPGIFTPNNDGFNDTWIIPGIDQYPEATIRIYNRTKKLMIELKGAQMPWDGRDQKGNLLESGSYFYQIELRKGGKQILGHVSILR